MLRDINRTQLQQAKDHALELVQDIEQMEAMLSQEDTCDNAISFAQNLLHDGTMNALNCSGIFQDIDKQAYKGTHIESKLTPEQKAENLKKFRLDEANKILEEYGVK
jgi:hypothetical protein